MKDNSQPQMTQMGADQGIQKNICVHLRNLRLTKMDQALRDLFPRLVLRRSQSKGGSPELVEWGRRRKLWKRSPMFQTLNIAKKARES